MDIEALRQAALSPVEPDDKRPETRNGYDENLIGLCLSGGGYRAMLFHLGSLWRLVRGEYLHKVGRVSSVSGGSIVAALLGLKWKLIAPGTQGAEQRFIAEVVTPIRSLASTTLDMSVVTEALLRRTATSERLAEHYRTQLYQHHTLQDLPGDNEGPRFIINASSLQTCALWRFMKPYMADWKVGSVPNPTVELAVAVAASSAFPVVFSPLRMKVEKAAYDQQYGLFNEPHFATNVVLADGGVYDNMGLETVWKRCGTVLVSDAGGRSEPVGELGWLANLGRLAAVVDGQVRALRKRQVIGSLANKDRKGAYWSTYTDIAHYELPENDLGEPLPCPFARTTQLANTATRLAALDETTQKQLINWGFAVCDAAMRRHVTSEPEPCGSFPYAEVGV